MKKIGIITIHKINNYGAALQAYALNQFLRNNRYDARTIDFRTPRVAESYQVYRPFKSIMDLPRNFQALLYGKKRKQRKENFDSFLKELIPMTEKAYFSDAELERADLGYDGYICGSDQIWNTHCTNYRDSFLLSFVKDKSKCISYAASVGESTVVDALIPKFKQELQGFKALSVREQEGAKVIGDITGREVKTVVDPVFLLTKEDWESFDAENQIKQPYIFFYFVHSGDVEGMRDFAKKMQKQLQMPLVVVNMNLREMYYKNKKCYQAGPKEFVSLIKNAKYVCTNSFHAVSFSVILQKNFWVFASTGKKSTASRILSITRQLGLENRVLDRSKHNVDMTAEIDYKPVQEKLDVMIRDSKQFLLDELHTL